MNVVQFEQGQQRRYLRELKEGRIPDSRPEFGDLEQVVTLIEKTVKDSGGNKRAIANVFEALRESLPFLDDDQEATQEPQIEVTSNEVDVPPLPEEIAVKPGETLHLCPQKDVYVAYSERKSPEGYEDYHSSCFWFMVSTIDGRRSAANLSGPRYAPLNIVLAGRSTAFAKTETANVIDSILECAGLDTLVTTGKLTPQKFRNVMSAPIPENYAELSEDDKALQRLKLARAAQRGWKYDEYGKLLTAAQQASGTMTEFVEILLELDNCRPRQEYGTIARGIEFIERPFLPLLGTLTPASIKKVASRGAELWHDGFFARTVFSCPPYDASKNQPFARGSIPVPTDLCRYLNEFNRRLGVPELDIIPVCNEEGQETGRYFKKWIIEPRETLYEISDSAYERWIAYRTALRDIANTPYFLQDLGANYGRLANMALRVATLAAALEGYSQTIELRHWLLGQEQAEMWRKGLHELYAQVNMSQTDSEPTIEDMLVHYLQSVHKPITTREIAQYAPPVLRKLKSKGIRDLLDSLAKSGVVEMERKGKTECFKYVS